MTPSALSNHRLYLHYAVTEPVVERASQVTLADWAQNCSSVLPEKYQEVLEGTGASVRIWEPVAAPEGRSRISEDILPEIRRLLGGERSELAQRWKLSEDARRLLSNGDLKCDDALSDHRVMVRLAMLFRNAAKVRLAKNGIDASPLRVKPENVELVWFASGVAFLIASVELERLDETPLSLFELQEAVHSFSRFNCLGWKPRLSDELTNGPTFSFGQIVRSLVQTAWPEGGESKRAMTYSYGQLAEHTDAAELDRWAAFLARRYTSDYAFEPEDADCSSIKEFSNMRHTVAREGIASLICPPKDTELPEFLRDWRTTALERAYLPLSLLLLHEDQFLSNLQGRVVGTDDETDDLEVFEEVINDALLLRLDYRWSDVSSISMHNRMMDALRAALSLDRRLNVMNQDVNAMAERLQAARAAKDRLEQEQRDYSLYTFGIWSTAALTGLTGFTIVKELHDVWAATPDATRLDEILKWWSGSETANKTAGASRLDEVLRWLPVFAGSVFAIISLGIGYKYRARRPGRGVLRKNSLRTMRQQMIRRARR